MFYRVHRDEKISLSITTKIIKAVIGDRPPISAAAYYNQNEINKPTHWQQYP